jgi:hypothetical protein
MRVLVVIEDGPFRGTTARLRVSAQGWPLTWCACRPGEVWQHHCLRQHDERSAVYRYVGTCANIEHVNAQLLGVLG